jgi:hypothetical protein
VLGSDAVSKTGHLKTSPQNQLGAADDDEKKKGTPKPQIPELSLSKSSPHLSPSKTQAKLESESRDFPINATTNHGQSRSDAGSREERRNRDKDDYKTSYEDDERDDIGSALSFENLHQDFMSANISFEGKPITLISGSLIWFFDGVL